MADLLVATNKGLYYVKDGEHSRLSAGYYYGITWNRESLFVGSSAPQGCVLEWKRPGQKRQKVPFPEPLHDIHQVFWQAGILYATNTAANRIDTWDGEQFSSIHWCEDSEDQHINSIWSDGDRFFVCEHRRGKPPVRIRIFDQDFEMIDTLEFRDLSRAHACGLHNVYVEDSTLYTLSVDRIVIVDAEGEVRTVNPYNSGHTGYLRGLARSGGYFFIGESEVRGRADRPHGSAKILVLDSGLQLVDSIPLKDVGQLHEIRALKGDRAHNGLPFPWELAEIC